MNSSDNPVPKSIIESYNNAYSCGTYRGTLEEFMRVTYLLFRTGWAGDREPPSFGQWKEMLLSYERDTKHDTENKG